MHIGNVEKDANEMKGLKSVAYYSMFPFSLNLKIILVQSEFWRNGVAQYEQV